MATLEAWQTYGVVRVAADVDLAKDRYAQLHAFWSGAWRVDPAVARQSLFSRELYENTRQLWRHGDAIVSLYEQFVYAGDLSTDGKPLPDGTRGAIPIDPQTGTATTDDAILRGCAELLSAWRFRQYLSLRPKLGAIYGDCLTELFDDLGRGLPFPRFVTPDLVTDLDLNSVGDVRRYTIAYHVPAVDRVAYGRPEKADAFEFRKEVDGEAFRYFKDDKPAAIPEWGIPNAVEPNPYGFAPAIWDRHEIVGGRDGPSTRGMSALERTMQQAMEFNSVLSHAVDYQRKQFNAPVGVVGGVLQRQPDPAATAEARRLLAQTDPVESARRQAETLGFWPMQPGSEYLTVSFDIGKTTEMLGLVMDSMLAEAPEARYGQQILDMTQVTAPGVERALGPIIGRVKRARNNYDPQTVKLLQMALAITGERLRRGDYPDAVVAARTARYDALRPFDLGSYGRGLLDFGIGDRAVIPESLDERIDRMAKVELLQTPWALRQAGVDEADIAAILGERAARQDALDARVTGIGGADEGNGEDGEGDGH